jgi:hypothetical protein
MLGAGDGAGRRRIGVEGSGRRTSAGGEVAAGGDGGSGALGPDRICPGFGAGGAARPGIGSPLGPTGGAMGVPLASGGRTGAGGRTGVDTASSKGAFSTGAFADSRTGGSVAGSLGGGATGGCGATRGGGAVECKPEMTEGEEGDKASPSCPGSVSGAAPLTGRLSEAGATDSVAIPSPTRRWRTARATSSSSELEWVFFSATPNSGNKSRMTLGLTSSSRASSLIRILLISRRPLSYRHSGIVQVQYACLLCKSPTPGQ